MIARRTPIKGNGSDLSARIRSRIVGQCPRRLSPREPYPQLFSPLCWERALGALRRREQRHLAGLEQDADILALDQPAQHRARFVQQPELVAELVEVADPAAHRE